MKNLVGIWHKRGIMSSKNRQLIKFFTTFKNNILVEVASISRGVFGFRNI